MFKIDRDYIKENSSGYAFDRGMEYHFGNRVRAIQYNPQKGVFTAAVYDLKERNISVAFDRDGRVVKSQCSCRLPGSSPNSFCEHIVAVLLLIEKRDGEGFFSQLKDREKARVFFELFSYPQTGTADGGAGAERARLETAFFMPDTKWKDNAERRARYGQFPHEYGSRFYFRLCAGKSGYPIKKLSGFVEALAKNRAAGINKKFTFEPSKFVFSGIDAEIRDFLLEMLDFTVNASPRGVLLGSGNADMFTERFLILSDMQFRRFIKIFADNNASIYTGAGAFANPARIIDAGIPLDFKLERDGDAFLLISENENDMRPLTAEGDVVFYKNDIYRLPKEQAGIIYPFLNMLDSYKDNSIRFVSEDRSRFVSEALPVIDRIGSLTIDDDVSSLIERNPITVDIYLDREDGAVSADVRFRYGETEFNPFAATPKSKAGNPDGRIIVRDVARENSVLDIFAEADFKVKNGKINLYDDDSVFDFIYDILPQLQKFGDVYYSEEFRRISLRRGIGFRANLTLKDSGGGLLDMLMFEFDTDLIDRDELIQIIESVRAKKRYYKLRDGSLLNIGERETLDVMRLFDFLEAGDEDIVSGRMALPRYRALYLDYYLRNSELMNIGRDRIFREFISSLSDPAECDYTEPESVSHVLRDYQRTGFKWLKALSSYSLGGILADDMGLGKTLEVLVLLLSAKEGLTSPPAASAESAAAAVLPSLIVAPTSLIYNWCAEIEKFTPGLRYATIYGGKAERLRLIASIPGNDVVITSYPLIRRDYDEYKKISFRYIVLDEAQYIKNPNSQNAFSVKCLNARSRFALTGTPIENSLLDLWSIFDFVLPGYLRGARAFSEKYSAAAAGETPDIARRVTGGVDGADTIDENGAADGIVNGVDSADENFGVAEANVAAGGAVNGVETADENGAAAGVDSAEQNNAPDGSLGGVTEGGVTEGGVTAGGVAANSGAEQADVNYLLKELSGQIKPFILRRLKSDVLRELPDKIDTRMYAQMTEEQKKLYMAFLVKIKEELESEISENGFEKSQFVILAALTRLRQICCHPALFVEGYEDDSGKFMLLQEIIREAAGGGHRILLFSQFTEMLSIIRKWVEKEGFSYHYIDGHIKAPDRHRMIGEFNAGAGDMFLLSLKAGGAGINLTGADTVIHYDPWWNPAVEDQATDRAYRIGQQKTVQVIKLLTAGSIEEKIYAIQERKKHLIDAVIRPGETFLSKLSKTDLDEILSI